MLTLGAGASMAASTTAAAAQPKPAPAGDRAIWVGHLRKLADPVLENLAAETLKRGCRSSRRPGPSAKR